MVLGIKGIMLKPNQKLSHECENNFDGRTQSSTSK
jgi:hypothetical protein